VLYRRAHSVSAGRRYLGMLVMTAALIQCGDVYSGLPIEIEHSTQLSFVPVGLYPGNSYCVTSYLDVGTQGAIFSGTSLWDINNHNADGLTYTGLGPGSCADKLYVNDCQSSSATSPSPENGGSNSLFTYCGFLSLDSEAQPGTREVSMSFYSLEWEDDVTGVGSLVLLPVVVETTALEAE
jgi:hypothetical protein